MSLAELTFGAAARPPNPKIAGRKENLLSRLVADKVSTFKKAMRGIFRSQSERIVFLHDDEDENVKIVKVSKRRSEENLCNGLINEKEENLARY